VRHPFLKRPARRFMNWGPIARFIGVAIGIMFVVVVFVVVIVRLSMMVF
jgi:tetrahydromethanopterin S-methyltransferase subunit F